MNILAAEADEADTIGLTKIAENITRQLEKTASRDSESGYIYTREDFSQDIQDNLWSVVIRTADFHGTHFDSKKAQQLVDFYSDKIVDELRAIANLSPAGAFEPALPGEKRETVALDLED